MSVSVSRGEASHRRRARLGRARAARRRPSLGLARGGAGRRPLPPGPRSGPLRSRSCRRPASAASRCSRSTGRGTAGPIRCPPDGGRRVASAVDDLEAALDAFDVSQVGVAGWSAGGRVALALAARRPELVDRVVVLATPAPDEEVAWIPRDVRAALEALRGLRPEQAQAELEARFGDVSPADGRSDDALAWLGAGPAETAALAVPGTRERLRCMVDDGVRAGRRGPRVRRRRADAPAVGLRARGSAREDAAPVRLARRRRAAEARQVVAATAAASAPRDVPGRGAPARSPDVAAGTLAPGARPRATGIAAVARRR